MSYTKRLIDANALMDAFRAYMVERYDSEKCVSEENCKNCKSSCLWRRIVAVAPTVDAVEVVHAQWDNNGICTLCGYPIPTDSKHDFIDVDDCLFCYHCGAKMDGGNEDA